MKLFDHLKKTVALLEPYRGCWAVCGGIAACIYRDTPRFTGDIDIVLTDHSSASAKSIAEMVSEKLGLKPISGWITDLNGSMIKEQALISGRDNTSGNYVGIDFILPVMPWVADAIVRAQHNLIDYGFHMVPTITIEDLIIAKLYAFQGTPARLNDLDDVQSIIRNQERVDLNLILQDAHRYGIIIPDEIMKRLSKKFS